METLPESAGPTSVHNCPLKTDSRCGGGTQVMLMYASEQCMAQLCCGVAFCATQNGGGLL